MGIESNKDIIKIRTWDWVLLVGMVMAPMTSLRIWKIGPAELLCFIWCLRFVDSHIEMTIVTKFFLFFLCVMTIGSIIGTSFFPNETNPSGLITWIYFALITYGLNKGISNNTLEYNERLLLLYTRISSILYGFLCFYAVYVGKTFFGLRLWYSNIRFTGGATNPHQVALMLATLIMFSLRNISRAGMGIVDTICILCCYLSLLQTRSSTAIMATAFGLFIVVNCWILRIVKKRKLFIITEVLLIAFFAVVFFSSIYRLVYNWITSDSNGLGRLKLFASYNNTFWKSPIFGLGPGIHANNGTIEYHNTYLEVLAAAGLVGFFAFVLFSFRLIKKTINGDVLFLPCVVVCYCYGLAGFGMRRLVYWIAMSFVITICEQKGQYTSMITNENKCLNEC